MLLQGDNVLLGISIWCICHTKPQLLRSQMFALLLHDTFCAIALRLGRGSWRTKETYHKWQQQCGQELSCLLIWKVAALQLLLRC